MSASLAVPPPHVTASSIEQAQYATGLLAAFNAVGALTVADIQPAQHLAFLYRENNDQVRLALALTVRGLRQGSLCIDIATIAADGLNDEDGTIEIPQDWWPEPTAWLKAIASSPLVTVGDQEVHPVRPLRLVDDLLYLERSWVDQESVHTRVLALLKQPHDINQLPSVAELLTKHFDNNPNAYDQARAVQTALRSPLAIIAGGPGTGKTTILRTLLTELHQRTPELSVALAAPTGKAAARMTDSINDPDATASTLHRLLGWRPGLRSRIKHHQLNPLPHDVVIVDELSMVSTTVLARLLEALKPTARLVLVGDPDQLSSVEAGAVLADLVQAEALAPVIAQLRHNFRFSGELAALATAIRIGDADTAVKVLRDGVHVQLLDPTDPDAVATLRDRVVSVGQNIHLAAMNGRVEEAVAGLDEHRILCGHRHGPFGVSHYTRLSQTWLTADVHGFSATAEFYIGRPVLATKNEPDLGLFNGDTGVIVAGETEPRAWFYTSAGLRDYAPHLLDGLTSVHAMTVHKSQGSQFRHVSVVLPPSGSPLLTRELLYTAVTRAEEAVLILGTEAAVREALARPTARISGLAHRLTDSARHDATGAQSELR